MAETTVLSAEEHFETLRESVWARFAARHRGQDRSKFEDLYAEWWAREVERAANGTPSRATAPAAFIAEAVHHVLIDDARARARGLGRGEKGSLEFVDIDDQYRTAAPADTASTATYEALVHRVLTLIQGRLSERERRVFVWSYLYLQPSEAAATALGLSVPRVKKDRKKIATKVGGEVWSVLAGELDLCAVYDEKSLPAVFEILTTHVEDCPVCGEALGGVRRGALAVIGPELLVLGAGAEHVTHGLSDLLARLNLLIHRGTETFTALPPQGRTAAAVAVAATAVAGGAVTVPDVTGPDRAAPPKREERVLRPSTPKLKVARTMPTPVPTAEPTRTAAPKTSSARPRRKEASPSAPEPSATQEPIAFEAASTPPPPPPPASAIESAQPAPPPASDEFGIEGP